MDKVIFMGDLTHKQFELGESCADLALPATHYELKDAIDKTHLDDGAEMLIEITDYTRFPFLAPYLEDCDDLYALNALAEKLATLDEWQIDALEGLVLIEEQKREPFGLPRIYDLAASTGECQVVYAATNDELLGKFYVDNDFVKETEDLPKAVYELLDYAEIGYRMRQGEGGVFLRQGSGYVTQVGDLKEEFKSLDLTPKAPDYTVLLEVGVPDTTALVKLKLPCEREDLDNVLNQLEARGWCDLTWRCADCRVPSLRDAFSTTDNIVFINHAARQLAELTDKTLPGYKALLEAIEASDLTQAMELLDRLDEYIYSPKFDTPEAVARDELVFMLGEGEAELAFPYVNLRDYGRKLMEAHFQKMTSYGVIERVDKLPILTVQERNKQQQAQPTMGGMEMTM